MNKFLKGLLVTALAASASNVQAYTNKTFLMPRSVGVDLPAQAVTFGHLIHHKGEDKFGGNFQITGFYQGTTKSEDAAKYFLFKDKSTVTIQKTAANPAFARSDASDLDLGYIIHNRTANANPYKSTLNFAPEQTAYGVRLDYHQDLGKILKGLYLYADLPIAQVENDLKINVVSADSVTAGELAGAAVPVKDALVNYFNGTFKTATAANIQQSLTNAKIAGKQSASGVADIDLGIGYKFLHKESYHAALALALTIPTGNTASGVYAFEPIYGNGHHFGLGGDLCAHARVWGDIDHSIKLNLKLKYRYLFENAEKRTLGIKGYNFGQYTNLVKAENIADNAPLALGAIPAANVTTLNVDVTPGSQFDGILGLAYSNGGFALDFGYNMFFKEAESSKLKDAFTDNVYAVAARNLAIAANAHAGLLIAAFTIGINDITDGGVAAGTSALLNKNTLDLSSAETPSQLSHSVYGGLGYIFKEWDTPVMLGTGAKYEWASKNSAFNQWAAYAKVGIGF